MIYVLKDNLGEYYIEIKMVEQIVLCILNVLPINLIKKHQLMIYSKIFKHNTYNAVLSVIQQHNKIIN